MPSTRTILAQALIATASLITFTTTMLVGIQVCFWVLELLGNQPAVLVLAVLAAGTTLSVITALRTAASGFRAVHRQPGAGPTCDPPLPA